MKFTNNVFPIKALNAYKTGKNYRHENGVYCFHVRDHFRILVGEKIVLHLFGKNVISINVYNDDTYLLIGVLNILAFIEK